MSCRRQIVCTALALFGAPLAAQETEPLKLRVHSSLGGGKVSVDRGSRDFVSKGDQVILRPRGGKVFRGVVLQVADRSSLVQLHDRSSRPAPGTRGEVLIPTDRGSESKPKPKPKPKPESKPEPDVANPRRGNKPKDLPTPTFRNRDKNWRPGMPLLDQGRQIRPSERPARVTGRFFSTGQYADTARDSNTDSFYRIGTDLRIDNALGLGGTISFDGEHDYRTELGHSGPEHDLLLREVSYTLGGTRFAPDRLEVGRFLQSGMPEFQILDGVEWGTRREGGDRYGASLGWLPEPDADFQSFKDFQAAAYYDWVLGEREQLTFTAAAQKTWHNGAQDRDLLLTKVRYLPLAGWEFHSTAWIDYYDGNELTQRAGFEVTQAFASLRHRYHNGDSADLTYRRVRFPDIDRYEFLPPLQQALADNRYDRLALSSRLSMTDDSRLVSQIGIWDDEEDNGGNLEFGTETQEVFLVRDRLDVALYGQLGQATTSGGARVLYSVFADKGSWDVFYQYDWHHFKSARADRNDLVQHWLRASRSFYTATGWELSIGLNAVYYDNELSYSVDFYLQRTF